MVNQVFLEHQVKKAALEIAVHREKKGNKVLEAI